MVSHVNSRIHTSVTSLNSLHVTMSLHVYPICLPSQARDLSQPPPRRLIRLALRCKGLRSALHKPLSLNLGEVAHVHTRREEQLVEEHTFDPTLEEA